MPASDAPAPLAPRYYRDNFLTLCATVEDRYGDLLSPAERDWLERFRSQLGEAAQCLYVRLVSRVGPWFRVSRLNYPEIGRLDSPLAELAETGLLDEARELPVPELGRLFTRADLLAAFQPLRGAGANCPKAELLARLEQLPLADRDRLAQLTTRNGERVVGPTGTSHVALMQLLFFGNRSQGLNEFVLSDLGIQRYYPYSLKVEQRLFSCREAVEEYRQLGDWRDRLREQLDAGERAGLPQLAREMLARQPVYGSSLRRWQRSLNRLARELERDGEYELALALYQCSGLHPARERRARVLENLTQFERALALCDEIREQPWCEAEREAAARMRPRLSRKLGRTAAPRSRDDFPTLQLRVANGDEGVERAAAAVLLERWHSVHYVENGLMCGLFGLALWDEIFAPVPGVFHHPFQRGPADMFQREFAGRREERLTRRLAELAAGPLEPVLRDAFRRCHGYQNQWVNWNLLDEDLLLRALHIIPAGHLLAIWRRILFDPRHNRAGFPDLVAFNDKPGDYALIEVKGPGDTLQDGQRHWLRFFQQVGIPSAVARVEWLDD